MGGKQRHSLAEKKFYLKKMEDLPLQGKLVTYT